MARNLFEKKLRFRLVDVEGVLLSVGGSLLINEPEGTEESKISLKRSKSKGVSSEFNNSDSPFRFDRTTYEGESFSGYDLIKAIKEAKGVDGKCQYKIDDFSTGSWVNLYTGNLDFYKLNEIDYSFQVLSRRVTLNDTFRTRKDVPVSFERSTALDGSAITGLTSQTMHLHSKATQETQKATSFRAESEEDLTSGTDWFLRLGYDQKGGLSDFSNRLLDEYGNEVETVFTTTPPESLDAHYLFRRTQGELVLDYTADYNLILEGLDGETVTHVGTYINIAGEEYEIYSGSTYNVTLALESLNISFSASGRFNLPEGSEVKIYDKWALPSLAPPASQYANNVTVNSGHVFELTFVRYEENTDAQVYNVKEALNHVAEVITGQSDLIVSDFLDNEGADIYITSGHLLRAFDKLSFPPYASFEDIFDKFLAPVFGLGYALVDDAGSPKIRVERYEYFYADRQILYLDSVFYDTYEEKFDNEIVFNKVRIGYSKIPSSTDENKANNIDEINTEHTLLTPIERVDRSETFISDVIASGYKIESQRREQFEINPKETVSNDEDLFVIMGINSDTYEVKRIAGEPDNVEFIASTNQIKILGTFYDFENPETFNITGSGMSNAGNYTISAISRDGGYTLLTVTSVSSDETFQGDITITLSASRLRAARDDEFEEVNNVIDRKTSYNLGLNPKYMLFNQSPLINSGCNFRGGSDLVITTCVRLNDLAQTQFKAGQGLYTLDPDKLLVGMGDDFQLNNLNGFERLMTGLVMRFEAKISSEEIIELRNAFQNDSDPNLNGYVRFRKPNGTDAKGFCKLISYDPLREAAEMELYEMHG